MWQACWRKSDGTARPILPKLFAQVEEQLNTLNIEGEVSGRPKHIYSIWSKMQRKNLSFTQVYDIRALRVLVPTVADCYAVWVGCTVAGKTYPVNMMTI